MLGWEKFKQMISYYESSSPKSNHILPKLICPLPTLMLICMVTKITILLVTANGKMSTFILINSVERCV